jgi:hypothetical protein
MTNINKPLPKDLPILTDVVGEPPLGLPTLTEVAEMITPTATQAPSATPILADLEVQLASLFEQKLQQHFATAQQLAIQQALAEFKRELPQLIIDTLNSPRSPT